MACVPAATTGAEAAAPPLLSQYPLQNPRKYHTIRPDQTERLNGPGGARMKRKRRRITMIAIASDHGGYLLKEHIKAYLAAKGVTCQDFGTDSTDSCDYPIFGKAAAQAVASGQCEKGIVICTTGIGISISANKVKGIRCALCGDVLSAEMTRRHNDANMLAMGAGIVGSLLAERIVDTFLNTAFEGGRHQRRVDEMMAIETEA